MRQRIVALEWDGRARASAADLACPAAPCCVTGDGAAVLLPGLDGGLRLRCKEGGVDGESGAGEDEDEEAEKG